MKLVVYPLIISFVTWMSIAVLSNTNGLTELQTWRKSCDVTHGDIKRGLLELRNGQFHILELLIDKNHPKR